MGCVQGYGESYSICFCAGNNVVLPVHILSLKDGPCLFNSTTLVIFQFKTPLPGLWLLCIYITVLILGVGRAILPNILPANHQLPR